MKLTKNYIVILISLMMILPFTFSCDRLDITAPRGEAGKTGFNGNAPTIIIGENGNWFIDGVDTGKTALGKDGKDGAPGPSGPVGPVGPEGPQVKVPEKPVINYPTVKITGSKKHKGGSLYIFNGTDEDKAKFDFVLRDCRTQFDSGNEVHLNESEGFYLNSTVYYAGTSSCDLWVSEKGESKWIKVGHYSQVETGGGFFGPSTFDTEFTYDDSYPAKE